MKLVDERGHDFFFEDCIAKKVKRHIAFLKASKSWNGVFE